MASPENARAVKRVKAAGIAAGCLIFAFFLTLMLNGGNELFWLAFLVPLAIGLSMISDDQAAKR